MHAKFQCRATYFKYLQSFIPSQPIQTFTYETKSPRRARSESQMFTPLLLYFHSFFLYFIPLNKLIHTVQRSYFFCHEALSTVILYALCWLYKKEYLYTYSFEDVV
ncbi:hypothetical protein EGW08_008146 [Elysia chlorotica]|uniref:Uncharacterized protein n=1 Tax=Elysia chlorotica TaxID=188477 RepID=A0A3S0ZRG1_ELYCH|nr:hypothetical protein EGW08_008146 [Elysia chlorotica]